MRSMPVAALWVALAQMAGASPAAGAAVPAEAPAVWTTGARPALTADLQGVAEGVSIVLLATGVVLLTSIRERAGRRGDGPA